MIFWCHYCSVLCIE